MVLGGVFTLSVAFVWVNVSVVCTGISTLQKMGVLPKNEPIAVITWSQAS